MTDFRWSIGAVSPRAYDWEAEFTAALDTYEPYILMDVGKVKGLCLAYKAALRALEEV